MTSQARVYYSLITRLREAGLSFVSLVPGTRVHARDLILTTRAEAGSVGLNVLLAELLDENPCVFKGQILSFMDGARETLLIGVDPGRRIGLAAYYGDTGLEFGTFDSVVGLCNHVATLVKGVPAKRSLVRIGNGYSLMAAEIARVLSDQALAVTLETVDESGTSARGVRMKGVRGDQLAAARIAFRKGIPFDQPTKSRP